MDRRKFIKNFTIALGSAVVLSKESLAVVVDKVTAAAKKIKVYAKEGVLGFKKEAPVLAVKANKRCENCRYFKIPSPVDPLCPTEGLCTLPGMKSAMKAENVYVESKAYCNMWQKAPVPAKKV